jgi:pilus assembly protein CpaF
MWRQPARGSGDGEKTVYCDIAEIKSVQLRKRREDEQHNRQELKQKILERIRQDPELMRNDEEALEDNAKLGLLKEKVAEKARYELRRERFEFTTRIEEEAFIKEVVDEALFLGPIEELLADKTVTEIMVNGTGMIFVERFGKIEQTNRNFSTDRKVFGVIERIVAPIGKRIDESSPYVDARLRDGSRVHIIIPPLSVKGPVITIRKFTRRFTAEELIAEGSLSLTMRDFLQVCVEGKRSLVVSGGTGTGKTTMLNVLSSYIPENERIITIEDTAELLLGNKPNLVTLETRRPNVEGKGEVTIRDLVRNALRMRPDRIVVGECRGGEAFDMLQAMNTGHEGSMTTVHANSPQDALTRLGNLVLIGVEKIPLHVIWHDIAAAVRLIVQIERCRDGTRKVSRVSEVMPKLSGEDYELKDVFVFRQEGVTAEGRVIGHFASTGYVPSFCEELAAKGLVLSPEMFDSKHVHQLKAAVTASDDVSGGGGGKRARQGPSGSREQLLNDAEPTVSMDQSLADLLRGRVPTGSDDVRTTAADSTRTAALGGKLAHRGPVTLTSAAAEEEDNAAERQTM